jgi:hypothetical protein
MTRTRKGRHGGNKRAVRALFCSASTTPSPFAGGQRNLRPLVTPFTEVSRNETRLWGRASRRFLSFIIQAP